MKASRWFLLFVLLISIGSSFKTIARPAKDPYYLELKVYHYGNNEQEQMIDNYLRNAFIPSLHSSGINNIGVFKAIANDTASVKKLYVFVPFRSIKQWQKYVTVVRSDKASNVAGEYIDARFDKPAYTRVETIFMRSFKLMPVPSAPKLTTPKSERVYELRSYESSSEKLHRNKVQMFNEGGEIEIFSRLGFNAIFYGEVIYGAKMPNLMYMTSFDNMKARDAHWAAFRDDPAWKKLSAMKEYQKNVSKNEMNFLRPTEYSDL